MLKNISNLGTTLNKKEQKTINGGRSWPTNAEDCVLCGGEWGGFACLLPIDSVCL